jgi:hypothetical protein
MSALTFDTLKYTERLRAAGVTEAQAKAEAEALRDALSEALDTTLATKGDLLEAKNEIKLGMSDVRHELGLLRWMMGILIALAAANFGKQFF